jgi:hypothetical protein
MGDEQGSTDGTESSDDERRAWAEKATRRALTAVLCLEAFCVLLVPRAIAQTPGGLGGVRTGVLVGFAVVLVLASALLRRPWGIGLGSVLQLPMIAVGFWVGAFFVIAVIFIAIWLYTLNLRHEIAGTPGGARMLVS